MSRQAFYISHFPPETLRKIEEENADYKDLLCQGGIGYEVAEILEELLQFSGWDNHLWHNPQRSH
jgi:hypothetical protein